MFKIKCDFYSHDIRIDLIAASEMANLNPKNAGYRAAAERGAFIVSVLQGDIYESVYTLRLERAFDTLATAKSFFDYLVSENPDAQTCLFVDIPDI
jgi:hypothetical protein